MTRKIIPERHVHGRCLVRHDEVDRQNGEGSKRKVEEVREMQQPPEGRSCYRPVKKMEAVARRRHCRGKRKQQPKREEWNSFGSATSPRMQQCIRQHPHSGEDHEPREKKTGNTEYAPHCQLRAFRRASSASAWTASPSSMSSKRNQPKRALMKPAAHPCINLNAVIPKPDPGGLSPPRECMMGRGPNQIVVRPLRCVSSVIHVTRSRHLLRQKRHRTPDNIRSRRSVRP